MTEPSAPTMLWPTYALRAWLTALLGQLERAGADIDARLEDHENAMKRLRAQKERSAIVINSLREAIGGVDTVLRETRDAAARTESERPRTEPREQIEAKKTTGPEKPHSSERAKS